MIVAEMLCAWFAGVVLGWRLGVIHRHTTAEVHHWALANGDRPAFDWAKEPE